MRNIENVTDLLVPSFTHVQLALGVVHYYFYSYSTDGTPAPYFDNVSFKVYKNVEPSALLVQPDGSGDYPTIQAAINAAADQDTVLLADGVFTGDGNRDLFFVGKEIIISSRSGNPEECIIDVEGTPSDNQQGGAIFCNDASPMINNCLFVGNEALNYAAGVYAHYEDVHYTISSCTFYGNINPAYTGTLTSYFHGRFDTYRLPARLKAGKDSDSIRMVLLR